MKKLTVLLVLLCTCSSAQAEIEFRVGVDVAPRCESRPKNLELYETNEHIIRSQWIRLGVVDRCSLEKVAAPSFLSHHSFTSNEEPWLRFDGKQDGRLRLRGFGLEMKSEDMTFRFRVRRSGVFITIKKDVP